MNYNLLKHAKNSNQDFEWYPTTKEMIDVVKSRLWGTSLSVLDIGAGDGRVLHALTKGDKYAIEKSRPLLSALTSDVCIWGTDFDDQVLWDKYVDVVFCNPPYSCFEDFSARIIREANASRIFLIIPVRWNKSTKIAEALKFRNATPKVLLNATFEEGDRRARAVIDVIEINIESSDPIKLWFETNCIKTTSITTHLDNASSALIDSSCVEVLAELYRRDFEALKDRYKKLDEGKNWLSLFSCADKLQSRFQCQLVELKMAYWERFISEMRILNALGSNGLIPRDKLRCIDFTENNALAVVEWLIKNYGYTAK